MPPPPTSMPFSTRRTETLPQRLLLLLCLVSSFQTVLGAIKNAYIDDEYGDEITRTKPVFLPRDTGVWEGEECAGCRVKPDPTKVFRNTYIAATYGADKDGNYQSRSFSFQFTGTALYVYTTLANNCGEGITTLMETNFTIDDSPPVFFQHKPDMTTTDFSYQFLAFSREGLEHRTHTFSAVTNGPKYDIYLNFDYAMYDDTLIGGLGVTTTQSSSTTTSSTSSPSSTSGKSGSDSSKSLAGPIAGGVVGGLAIFILFILALFFMRRRSKREALLRNGPPPKEYPNPAIFGFTGHAPSTAASRSMYSAAGGTTHTRDRSGTLTTTTDWSSGYAAHPPVNSRAAVPYTYHQPTGSGASLSGIAVMSVGAGQSVQTTRSGGSAGSTSKRDAARSRSPLQGSGAQASQSMYPPPPHAEYNPYASSRSASPAGGLPRLNTNVSHSNIGRNPNPSNAHPPAGNPSGALDAQVRQLQESIRQVMASIQSERDAMRGAGMSDEEIEKDRSLEAMKQSLRVMSEQMAVMERGRTRQAGNRSDAVLGIDVPPREELPEYESPTGESPPTRLS
ncbi:hypothetical protein DFP72DRAFT_1059764 [Ephemerocybe angulata]|uniref:Uncharacterized protein n=1 Tax=Ephemerocybe angulata TaxID=980116 RepID=A0A8H6IDX7_9AGAR|nr:hypothetical protein DFP72DRAFT_1059764 [Tulosesus angulatus]